MTLIGFYGRLGSGKDTAADRLGVVTGEPVQRISFARKLKESAAALWGFPPEDWEALKNSPTARFTFSSDIGEISLTGREFLQRYGTEAHRDVFGANFWIEQALKDYDPEFRGITAVTDVRFDNEAEAIHALGGRVVQVRGPEDPEMYFEPKTGVWCYRETEEPVHMSEWPIAGIDHVIDNTTRDDGFAALDEALDLMWEYGISEYSRYGD